MSGSYLHTPRCVYIHTQKVLLVMSCNISNDYAPLKLGQAWTIPLELLACCSPAAHQNVPLYRAAPNAAGRWPHWNLEKNVYLKYTNTGVHLFRSFIFSLHNIQQVILRLVYPVKLFAINKLPLLKALI